MIEAILNSDQAELTQGSKMGSPVVLSTRIRLARNLTSAPFPERASLTQKRDVMTKCTGQIALLPLNEKRTFSILLIYPILRNKY